MFDIGWSEMAVVALIALLVIGPKELPKTMRSLAKWIRKARSMAREFQSGIDDMVREADLEDARKAVESAKTFDINKTVEETIDPAGDLTEEAKELQDEMEREAAGENSGDIPAADSGSDAGAEVAGETESATVIEHPVNIAPPHSLTPPPEDAAAEPEPEEVVAADGDSSQRRA